MEFKEIFNRLYVYDASNDLKNKDTKKNVYNYSFASTTRSIILLPMKLIMLN